MSDLADRCEDCDSELVYCGRLDNDGIPRLECPLCKARERSMELEAELSALKAQLTSAVPIEEYAADMQKAYEEGRYDEQHTDYGTSLYEQPAWEGSETKQHIDERRKEVEG